MLKKILIVLALIIVVCVVVVAVQPSQFRVSRSAVMAAPASAVYEHVNDLHKWETWSPWAKLDPNMKGTYDGPPSGVGAAYSWAGNGDVGEGKMTITESRPNELVKIRLEFLKPMAGTSDAEIAFKPEGDKTSVSWTMTGENNFIGKAMCLVMNMDKMVGGQFEAGFASLKSIVEKPAKK